MLIIAKCLQVYVKDKILSIYFYAPQTDFFS